MDFSYEVSRSLQACEGALLVIDASQGIEAQTLANAQLATEQGLVIIPVINKVDLASADPPMVMAELEETLAIPREEAILASAKDGTGVDAILEAIVSRIPSPPGDPGRRSRRLSSTATTTRTRASSPTSGWRTAPSTTTTRSGSWPPGSPRTSSSSAGSAPRRWRPPTLAGEEVGTWPPAEVHRRGPGGRHADHRRHPAPEPLPGYRPALPLVFAGIYPLRGDEYPLLRDALDKLHLNDASFVWEPESSVALGHGFRCGFLGLLHMEIVQERLEREFDLDLIASAPSVEYRVRRIGGARWWSTTRPRCRPRRDRGHRRAVGRPPGHHPHRVRRPGDGAATARRGTFQTMEYLDPRRVNLRFEMPLAELIVDFYDQLKGRSSGYASLDYAFIGYRSGDLVKLDILVNGEPVDALSLIVHRSNARASVGAWRN